MYQAAVNISVHPNSNVKEGKDTFNKSKFKKAANSIFSI